ncbi:hypothetical protein PDJAM_G00214140 [Pangasius djambal]|uniref:Uncharacterized protein n=1 Tax=Pangasius djambal TaxID=1691987 RepID=A0ACC5YAJ8_9TELE|nr:hypothetical protein [Pangasius djambal]
MPYRLWKLRLFCPVCGKQLTGYGIHKRARRVLDINRYYLMVTETLRCTVCRLNYISTSETVLNQLDLPHRTLFRVILTYKYACDIHVICLLRERTLGNSPTRLARQLKENHGEEWLHHLAHYMEECAVFADRPSFLPVAFQEPPGPIAYQQITKKLAGHAWGTVQWMSSVGSERGQILISVLTAQEGPGLDSMVSGLVSRYQQAGVAPLVLLYVDSGCCVDKGQSKLQTWFGGWPNLNILLDIWHFMRRLATGVKREQLEDERLPLITDDLVNRRISKKELALYCRWRTHGVKTIVRLIDHLLQELKEEKGRDLMGVPLLDTVRMEHIWHVQKRHMKCIQDVPGVSLYTETGTTTTTTGGIVLTRYRCARGSTSLESFHCHMQRFIPGELIGVDYLLAQTGQPLQRVDPDAEATDQLLEEVNVDEQEDEGFEEDLSDDPTLTSLLEDLTTTAARIHPAASSAPPAAASSSAASSSAPPSAASSSSQPSVAPSSAPPPATSSSSLPSAVSSSALPAATSTDMSTTPPGISAPDSSTQVPEETLAVDDRNVPGMDRVDSLADYLVELRHQTSLTLNSQQVSEIVALWQNLLDFDKQRVVFAARHQERLTTGSGQTVAGSWRPFSSDSARKGKGSLTRWSLILHDYRRIRQLILNNGAIIQSTNLQLVEVNQTTLVQWHNERVRRQDLTLLLQGMDLHDPLPVAAEPLQSASARPAARARACVQPAAQHSRASQTEEAHHLHFPPDPHETARPKLAPKRQLLPRPPGAFFTLAPHPSPTYTVFVVPGPSATTTPQASSTPPSVVLQPPQASSIPPASAVQPQMPRRPHAYTRRVEANTCKKCGRHRTAETGHSQ